MEPIENAATQENTASAAIPPAEKAAEKTQKDEATLAAQAA